MSMQAADWIEFAGRAAAAGVGLVQLAVAMRNGDLDAVEELGKRLDPADKILARAEAKVQRQKRLDAEMQESSR